jgi:hypothetical protein
MTSDKLKKDKRTVAFMIAFYCRHKEGNKTLCHSCSELLDYAFTRLERCRYGKKKPSCKTCPTHCYSPEMRNNIRKVMRYSGPRMFLYAPYTAIKHFLLGV